MDNNEKNILRVTCYGHFLSHCNMLVFPAVLIPLADELQLSLSATLSLSFWMYLLFGITALPWGLLADRLSPRILLSLFYLGAGISCLAVAFFIKDPLFLAISLTGIGLFSGIYHPVGLGWIARDIKNISLGMGYNGMFGNLGLAVAPLFAGLINYFFGLFSVYFLLGVLNLIGAVLLIKAERSNGNTEVIQKKTDYRKTMLPFGILLAAMMLGGVVYRGTSVTLPAYFQLSNQELFLALQQMFGGIGNENVVATMITSIIYFLGMLGQFTGGKVGERFDLRRSYCIFHLLTIPAAVAMAMTTNIPLIGFAVIHSFFLLGMQPIENTLVSRLAPAGLMSSAYGLKFILTFGVGALSVKMVEVVKEIYGFSAIYLVLAGISTLLVSCILLLILKTSPLQMAKQKQ